MYEVIPGLNVLVFPTTVAGGSANMKESSFNMTRGGGGDEDIVGGLRKVLDTRRGGSEKIFALGGGAPKI